MRRFAKGFLRVLAALYLIAFPIIFFASPAGAAGVGQIVSVVNAIFGGPLNVTGATTGQTLVKQADGSWKPAAASSSQTLDQVLTTGNKVGPHYIEFDNATSRLYAYSATSERVLMSAENTFDAFITIGSNNYDGGHVVINAAGNAPTNGSVDFEVGGSIKAKLSPVGSFILNATGAALAQNATDGFTYVPTCLTGAPSGTPTSVTGAAPVVVGGDNKLYFYAGGAWTQAGGGGTSGVWTVKANTTAASVTLDSTATVWPMDTTSNTITVTLPDAAANSGRIFVVKKIATANSVTFNTTSAQTIDQYASGALSFTAQWQSFTFISNGSNWLIVG